MRQLIAIVVAAALAGCGVETATTAATVAVAAKQEAEQGRNTLDRATLKVGTAMEQARQRAEPAEDAAR